MRYPPSILDEIRARLPVSHIVSRRVKLKRNGREYTGLSPFKQEKTPSFTVNDHKGFYHCFATGEHGDIFKFLMTTEGLSFPEAVERLAEEAHVQLPKPTPQAERSEAERDRLLRLMEASCVYFEDCLRSPQGADARAYLERRGLTENDVKAFRLGYAPHARSALKGRLADLGFTQPEMVKSGMLVSGDGVPVSYDRFRNRLMFPIGGLNGQIVAFGGRALDADQTPKYLNSPETPLFHKGAILYNASRARSAAHERGFVVASEGYMDVIAFSRAGVPNAVAPLGTALTPEQLKLLWRMADEPILCFDGDLAGQKAACRAVDTALPHLAPGKSLSFVFLPEGQDPDDMLRNSGAETLRGALKATRPLIDVLWAKELSAGEWTTPERRAALEQRLISLTESIANTVIRGHYLRELKQRLYAQWRTPRAAFQAPGRAAFRGGDSFRGGGDRKRGTDRGFGAPRFLPAPPGARESLVNSALVRADSSMLPRREALIMITLLNHPWLIEECAEEIAELQFEANVLHSLRDSLLHVQTLQNPLDKEALHTQLVTMGLNDVVAQVERAITHKSDRNTQPGAPKGDVLKGWRHMLALHHKSLELKRELEAAEQAYTEEQSEQNLLRLCDVRGQFASADGAEASIEGYGAESEQGRSTVL
jgi:DNA primase